MTVSVNINLLTAILRSKSGPAGQLFSFPAKSARKVTCTVQFAVLIGLRLQQIVQRVSLLVGSK